MVEGRSWYAQVALVVEQLTQKQHRLEELAAKAPDYGASKRYAEEALLTRQERVRVIESIGRRAQQDAAEFRQREEEWRRILLTALKGKRGAPTPYHPLVARGPAPQRGWRWHWRCITCGNEFTDYVTAREHAGNLRGHTVRPVT